jgi:uncharacterized protein (TIGR02270 family)
MWTSRRAVARSSAVTFDVLAGMDERLSRLVYKLSERPVLADSLLEHDHAALKSGLAFVIAIVALRGRMGGAFKELLTRLESDPELLSPLASALTWLEYEEVRPCICRLLGASSLVFLQLGVVAAMGHGVDPGVALNRALDEESPAVRASAYEAVGRLALGDLRRRLHAALTDQDPTCRFWAAWAAVRLGDRAGIPVLGRFATECGAFARPACDLTLRAFETDRAICARERLLSMTGNERLGVLAAGIIGDPALASWLLNAMESPGLARAAGAAFCLMTGRDLRRDDLDAERPPGVADVEVVVPPSSESKATAEQPSPDQNNDSLGDEADDDLAWPDTVRLGAWWNQNRGAFVPGIRYLAGMPIQLRELANVLRTGNQQQRSAAALELALLDPDEPLLDVTAPAHRQIGT